MYHDQNRKRASQHLPVTRKYYMSPGNAKESFNSWPQRRNLLFSPDHDSLKRGLLSRIQLKKRKTGKKTHHTK
jgi:predicted N-formylglutamate amidohydrolase